MRLFRCAYQHKGTVKPFSGAALPAALTLLGDSACREPMRDAHLQAYQHEQRKVDASPSFDRLGGFAFGGVAGR